MKNWKQLVARFQQAIESVPAKKIDMGLAVLVTLAALVVYAYVQLGSSSKAAFSFIQNVELRSLDARLRVRGARPADDRIVIVGIDEKTLQKVGAWPIPRNAYAAAIDKMSEGGARVIGFDVDFPTPEKNSAVEALQKLQEELGSSATPPVLAKIRALQQTSDNDRILADSLHRSGRVVLGHLFLDQERAKSQDEGAAKDYFFVLSGKPFPQVVPATAGRQFDLNDAFVKAGGPVTYGVESNIRILAESARSYGFFNNDPDFDGTMRHTQLLVRYGAKGEEYYFPSLPLEILRVYDDIKDQSTTAYIAEDGLERMDIGPYSFPTLLNGSALINYVGPYNSYKHYSLADVADGTVPPETFKDKIVLVGATAIGIGDLRITPFPEVTYTDEKGLSHTDVASYMGVEIHANVLDNLLHSEERSRTFLRRGFNAEMIDIFLIVSMGLGLGYLFGRTRPLTATIIAVGAVALFVTVVYFAFAQFGLWLSFVIPVGLVFADYAAITSFRMIFEEREKRKIRKSFSSYVSPGVIQLIEEDPKKYFRPGGEMKELTIMFSDIRSFTTIAEGLTPDELVHLLNEYLSEMTEILFREWGTLDKYIGDAIMAFWGSPYPQEDHAVRACRCAMAMSNRLDELNLKWEAQGRKQLSIGIGLNSGPVNVGNMGSDKRLAWTVMGDNVNLASRLEGQTKDYHVRIIVNESTYLEARENFVFRDLDKIRVKGKLKPVNIYQLLGFAGDLGEYVDLLDRWNRAQELYRAGMWKEALEGFETVLRHHPGDGPAETFIHRCVEKISEDAPQEAWDGVYVAKNK